MAMSYQEYQKIVDATQALLFLEKNKADWENRYLDYAEDKGLMAADNCRNYPVFWRENPLHFKIIQRKLTRD